MESSLVTAIQEPMLAPLAKPILGHLLQLKKDPLGFLLRVSRETGDIIQLKLGPRKVTFLKHPEFIKHVFLDESKNYDKGTRGWDKLRVILRKGVFTSDGKLWQRQRKTMQPGFQRERIISLARVMIEETQNLVTEWELYSKKGQAVDVHQEMMKITFRIIAKSMFSEDLNQKQIQMVSHDLPLILDYGAKSYQKFLDLPLSFPTPVHLKVRKAVRNLDNMVMNIIKERRKKDSEDQDLLSILLNAKDPDTGMGMDDMEIRDQVMTIMLAGHETTANSLSFALYLLSKNPAITHKLESEADNVLNGNPPGIEDLTKLRFTLKVFQEALRLFPPVWLIPRRSLKEDTIGGMRIPQGRTVFVCTFTLHRDPRFWEDPETFNPERFTEGNSNIFHNFTYIPFGVGARTCMGKDFALIEAPIILATLFQKFRIISASDSPLTLDPSLTLRPKKPIWAKIQMRN